jgi:hypothetical protein
MGLETAYGPLHGGSATHTHSGPAHRQLMVQLSAYVHTAPGMKHGAGPGSELGQPAGPSTSAASRKGTAPSKQLIPRQLKTPGGSQVHWRARQSPELGTKHVAPTSEQASPFWGGAPDAHVEGVEP